MKPKLLALLPCYFIVLALIVLGLENILYKNISISEPLGYYLALPGLEIHKGDLMMTCISNNRYKEVFNKLGLHDVNGQCENHLPYLIKRVAAIKGDKVAVTINGIEINGILQPNSKQFVTGRGVSLYPLPVGYKDTLTKDEYFMLGSSLHSVDSRYFGVVQAKNVYRRAILIYKIDR